MQFLERFRAPGRPDVRVLALAAWAVLTLVFAALPESSAGRAAVAGALLWGAAAFGAFAFWRAVVRVGRREKLLWGLLGAGLLLRLAGHLAWNVPLAEGLYLASYALLFGGMVVLIALATRIAAVSFLDALAITLSVGTLVYFFAGGPLGFAAGPWQVPGALFLPAFDSALLFLGLVMLSVERRPPSVAPLALGFLAFLAADGLYLGAISDGQQAWSAGWPGPFFSLGAVLLGIAALRAATARFPETDAWQNEIAPWRILVFWLGPLSPTVHFGLLFLWGALYPPLPTYVYWGAAGLLLYLAFRVALVSLVTRRIVRRQKEATRRLEQSRLLNDLHGTVKQGVHGVSLILEGAVEADRRGEPEAVRSLVGRALEASREVEYGVSRPYDEARDLHEEPRPRLDDLLRGRLARFEKYFGIKAHEDLRASLDALTPAEQATVTRVLVEALWNVAKHSGARNAYLESRRIGSVLLVRVRDDGRGFDAQNPPPGMGLRYVRRRAAEVGAELDVISTPGSGATVQLRFEQRQGF